MCVFYSHLISFFPTEIHFDLIFRHYLCRPRPEYSVAQSREEGIELHGGTTFNSVDNDVPFVVVVRSLSEFYRSISFDDNNNSNKNQPLPPFCPIKYIFISVSL